MMWPVVPSSAPNHPVVGIEGLHPVVHDRDRDLVHGGGAGKGERELAESLQHARRAFRELPRCRARASRSCAAFGIRAVARVDVDRDAGAADDRTRRIAHGLAAPFEPVFRSRRPRRRGDRNATASPAPCRVRTAPRTRAAILAVQVRRVGVEAAVERPRFESEQRFQPDVPLHPAGAQVPAPRSHLAGFERERESQRVERGRSRPGELEVALVGARAPAAWRRRIRPAR